MKILFYNDSTPSMTKSILGREKRKKERRKEGLTELSRFNFPHAQVLKVPFDVVCPD